MTIDELIMKLKEIEEKYGNIEVKIDHPNDIYTIRSVWVYGLYDEDTYVAIKI